MTARTTPGPANRDARAALERSLVQLLLREPFYAAVASHMYRKISEDVDTLAVAAQGGRLGLLVNPSYFLSAGGKLERLALVKHELLHVVLGHVTRVAQLPDPRLGNVAADLVVNSLLAPLPAPPGAITTDCFPDLDLPADGSLEEYYGLLAVCLQDHGKGAPRSAVALQRLLAAGRQGHDAWTPGDAARHELLVSRILREAARAASDGYALLPGAVQAALAHAEAARPGTVDWRSVLRLFAGRRTTIRTSRRRRSKRFGTFPGTRVQAARHHIAVAIDTSGSVTDEQLTAFFLEVHSLFTLQKTAVTVLLCDAAVHAAFKYTGVPPQGVVGRGGTAFDPVFAWLGARRDVDALVYLTDGFAPAPTHRAGVPCLWVLTPDGQGDHLKTRGRVIRMRT